jgi:hypothetical protein
MTRLRFYDAFFLVAVYHSAIARPRSTVRQFAERRETSRSNIRTSCIEIH